MRSRTTRLALRHPRFARGETARHEKAFDLTLAAENTEMQHIEPLFFRPLRLFVQMNDAHLVGLA